MKESTTKKSLRSSGLALLVCIVMLIGTTFAWFTDSITNRGNIIQSGTLDIGATAYDLGEGGVSVTIPEVNGGTEFTFEETGANLEKSEEPILNDDFWEPGKSNAKLLEVTNKGTLAAKVKLDFNVKDNGLQDALWFDFVMVDEAGNVQGAFQKKPMNQLQQVANAVEVKLVAKKAVRFVLVYGMNEDAGNEYQNKTFNADVIIKATQLNSEQDGFGNPDYDKDSEYEKVKVESGEQLIEEIKSLNEGDKLEAEIVNNIEINETFRVPEKTEVVIDGNGKKIELPDNNAANKNTISNVGDLTIKDCTIINKDTGNTIGEENPGSNAAIASGGNLTLENCTISNSAGILGTYSVLIDNGTAEIKNCDIYGTRGGLAISNNAVVNITGGTVTTAYYYPVTAYGNGHSVCTDVTFVKVPKLESQSGEGGNALIYNQFDPEKYGDKGSLTFNNCKFKSTRSEGSNLEIFNNFKGLLFNNCTYENVKNLP